METASARESRNLLWNYQVCEIVNLSFQNFNYEIIHPEGGC